MSQEKKFKVGDEVVVENMYCQTDPPRRGTVDSVGKRWVKVAFRGRVSKVERWDAFTGRLDSESSGSPLLTKAEYEDLVAKRAARAKPRAVGVTVDERVGGHLPVIEVWAALEPLVAARAASSSEGPTS